jgi:hypothetical protein
LSFGLVGAGKNLLKGNATNWKKFKKNKTVYSLLNYLSMGTLDVGKTFITAKPGSKKYWDSFFSLAGMIVGGKYVKGGKVPKGKKVPKGIVKARASVDERKFSQYIFKEGATHGKDVIFKSMGYSKRDSKLLANMWKSQAQSQIKKGKFKLGKADKYGQRITIEIKLPSKGKTSKKTKYLKSGWIIKSNKTVSLTTPFSGFSK